MTYVKCQVSMSNTYVDPWDMLNNFCFEVYAQKWVLVIMSHVTCHILHVTCHMSHCACHMSYIKCLCWFSGHAEQLLFSCLCSKVSICNYVTCHMLHVACHMSYVKCLGWSLGHAEQLLFWCLCSKVSICDYVTCRMSHVTCHMWHVICEMLRLILGTCWTIFVFMSMLKCRCLWV